MAGEPLYLPHSDAFDDDCAIAYQHAVTHGRYTRQGVAEALGISLEEAAQIEKKLQTLSLLHPTPRRAGHLRPGQPRRCRRRSRRPHRDADP